MLGSLIRFLRRAFSPLSLILLLIGSSAYAQFGFPVPLYPNETDGLVNMINGRQLYFSETDLAIPGRGLGLEFTRYHNSWGAGPSYHSTAFIGFRWSHNYQWRLELEFNPSGRRGTYYSVITGSGAKQTFKLTTNDLPGEFIPDRGVRAKLQFIPSDTTPAFLYTTKHGIRYKFEWSDYSPPNDRPSNVYKYMLTEILDTSGNRIRLHYEKVGWPSKFRLVAVEDTLSRILKFYYELEAADHRNDYQHFVTKIEFGKGTPQALSTVYTTISYSYISYTDSYGGATRLTTVRRSLGTGDPRGSELVTQYEFMEASMYSDLSAIVSPAGHRTELAGTNVWEKVHSVKERTSGTVLHMRKYKARGYNSEVYDIHQDGLRIQRTQKRNALYYNVNSGQVTSIIRLRFEDPPADGSWASPWPTYISSLNWGYDTHRNLTSVWHRDRSNFQYQWAYTITYAGANSSHNKQMGNPTKWEQRNLPNTSGTVLRKWEADYETTYNKPLWQIDSMGHKTEFTYDTKGNLTQTKSKASTGTQAHAITHDIITTHQYDTYGNRIKTTFMPGTTQQKIVQTVYDSTYHTYPVEVKTTVTVNGTARTIRTRSEWDVNRGWKTADIDAMGRRTEYAYWKDGLLKYTRRVADNLYTIPTYDKNGNVTMTQVRQSNWQTGTIIAQTKTEYDGMGRPKKVHRFNNNNWSTPYATTESTYDIFGNLTQTKDPRGLITRYEHDKHGRVTKQTLPDGDWVETRYNFIDQVTKAWTSQTGSETAPAISHTYDNLNRPLTTTYSTRETVSFTYDKADNPLTMTTNDGATTYTYTNTYDQLNRLITRTDSLLNKKTLYEYNDSGTRKRVHIQPSTGGSDLYDVTYTYDEANRLLSVRDVLSNKTASYTYFDNGALKTTTLPNGITAHRTLDSLNRLNRLQYKKTTTTDLARLDYTYDVKSNVTRLVRNDIGAGGSNKTFTFGYDGISRLTSANYGNERVTYTYDKVGNRKTMVSTTKGTTTYTIATNSNQLTYRSLVPEDTAFATMSYTYDAEGKLTQRSEGTDSDAFTYGWGGMLKQIQKTRASTVTQTVSYSYDGAGQRVKVTDSGGTRYFLYHGGMPLLELNATKNITASYLYGADGVVYRKKHTSTPSYEYHLKNALGSTIIETNNSKTVLARYEYDVFGAVRSETGSSDNVRKFTGKEYDADVKLYKMGIRPYDPYTGRFTQRDPIGDGINWYAYAANNPLKYIDPTGTKIVLPGGAEITSVPGTDENGHYIRPEGLTDEAGLFWDALFTGGANGTGIVGSDAMGDELIDIIVSPQPVKIQFGGLKNPNANAETDLNTHVNKGAIIVKIKNQPSADVARIFAYQMAGLAVSLVHELSHVHNAITYPDVYTIDALYKHRHLYFRLELHAYDRVARFVIEMDTFINNGIPVHNWGNYSKNSQFSRDALSGFIAKKYLSIIYMRNLFQNAGNASRKADY